MTQEDARLKEAREKRDSINKDIGTRFKDKGWGDASTFVQGSYATGTAIVPLDGDYDIDIAVVIPSSSAPNNPVIVKQEFI